MKVADTLNLNVISLESSLSRRELFALNNRHLDFEFFPAIVGKHLTLDELSDPLRFIQPLRYSAGAYGCALSHSALWEKSIAIGQPMTIVEDDAILRFDFHARAAEQLDALPSDWDIVLWGWNFDAMLSIRVMSNLSPVVLLFDQDALRNGLDSFQALQDEVHLYLLDQCFGTLAYTISPKGARRLKSICFPIRDFVLETPLNSKGVGNNGIDIVMNQIYGLTQAYVSFPPLAVSPNLEEESTIAKSQPLILQAQGR